MWPRACIIIVECSYFNFVLLVIFFFKIDVTILNLRIEFFNQVLPTQQVSF